jgi:hypothetical protein
MARSLKIYQGEDQTPVTDLTEPDVSPHVIWEEIEAGHRAYQLESTQSSFPMRDEQGETGNEIDLPVGLTRVSLAAHNRLIWDESGTVLFRGRVGPKDYSRGRQLADRAREVTVNAQDINFDLRGIIVDGWTRPSETDVARIQALIADYLSGSPRVTTDISTTYIAAGSNTITLPALRYDSTDPETIFRDIATQANKLAFITVDNEAFYDGWDSTAYLAGLRISDRHTEWTTEGSSEPASSVRLYPTGITSGSGAGESAAAPALGGLTDADASWGGVLSFPYKYMYDNPQGVAVGTTPDENWAVVNSAAGSVVLDGFVHYLDGDLLSIVQNGGVARGQHRMKSRHGIGVDEGAQQNFSNFAVRVYRPGTGIVATLVDVGDSIGAVRFEPSTNGINNSFGPATMTPYPSAVSGDYLVVDVGTQHVGPTTGATGAGIFITDTEATDYGIDSTDQLLKNTWWQFGPAEEALPTYPPIWDVGPASTEDGMQLLSGLRLYYGAEASQYVYVSSPTTANQYSHYEESLHTTDPAISNAAQALVLANSILARRKYEERTYNVSVGPLDENEITLLKPGQLIDIKARAIPDADDQYVSRRIAQLKWTTPVPGMFFAHMQLDRPIKEVPHSVGNKAGHEAIGQHALNGSNSHPEFVPRAILTTQGDLPYRGGSDWTRLAIGSSNTWLKSTGVVPVWASLPSSSGTIAVEEDGSEEGSAIARLNFTTGLDVSVSGDEATISAAAGGLTGQPIAISPNYPPVAMGTNTNNTAQLAWATPIVVPAAMKVRGMSIEVTSAGSGSIQWGLFDYSSNPAAATKLAGGSAAPGGTGWRSIAATGAPVSVAAGCYMLVWQNPSSNASTVRALTTSSAVALPWNQLWTTYTWDDTPDFTSASWVANSTMASIYLEGDLDASNNRWT